MSEIDLLRYLSGTPQSRNSLGFMTRRGALYLGPDMKTTVHALHNYIVYIAINGNFDLLLGDGRIFTSCETVVIAPDWPHNLVSSGVMLGVFYLIPETVEGRRMTAAFSGRKVFMPSGQVRAVVLPLLRKYLEHGCSMEEADELCRYLFNNLTPPSNVCSALDPRVRHALEYLDSIIGSRVTIAEIAAEVALSHSRLEHLFSEQIGIPISRYLLWARTRQALLLMANSKSLTAVAFEAGFADSAHLSRTFRRMLGISPSTLLRKTSLYSSIAVLK